jgi:hypothetical protein
VEERGGAWRSVEERRVVTKASETGVAATAQQLAEVSHSVIVIYMEMTWLAASVYNARTAVAAPSDGVVGLRAHHERAGLLRIEPVSCARKAVACV